MAAAVDWLEDYLHEGDGAREDGQVVGKQGRGERGREADSGTLEDGAGGEEADVDGDLRQGRLGAAAKEAVGLAIDEGYATQEVGAASPVGDVGVGEVVRGQPEAEVGVDGSEGD